MKKIFIIFFCHVLLVFNIVLADEIPESDLFSYYYDYVSDGLYSFRAINNKDYKALPKMAKIGYKQIVKADKLWNKGLKYSKNDWHRYKYFEKAYNLNPTLYPVAYDLGFYYYDLKNYQNSIYYYSKIPKSFNSHMDIVMALVYNSAKQYNNAINSAKEFLKIKDLEEKDIILANYIIMNSYNGFYVYNEALKYANTLIYKYPKAGKLYLYEAWDVRYKYYHYRKDYKLALEAARKMLELEKNYDNYMKVAGLTSKDETLKLYYQAKPYTQSSQQKNEVMAKIAKLEQEKIDNAVKKLKVYVKKPDWYEIISNAKYGNLNYWYNRQDNFFKSANNCINTQYGNNLVACFNQINSEQDKLTQQLNEDVYRAQQLAIQQESVRQQQIQNYYNAESVYWQQQNYYLNDRMRRYIQYGY